MHKIAQASKNGSNVGQIPPLSNMNLSFVYLCVRSCLCNKHQYLSQIQLDLHETFSISSDWSSELIYNVCGGSCAHMHAKCMKTCTQLNTVGHTSFSQTNELRFSPNLVQSSWRYEGCPIYIFLAIHACTHMHACTCYVHKSTQSTQIPFFIL